MSDSGTGREEKSETFVCTQRMNNGNSYYVGQDTHVGKWSMALGQIMCVRPQKPKKKKLIILFWFLSFTFKFFVVMIFGERK